MDYKTALNELWTVALAAESRGYNDYNYYKNTGLVSYLDGISTRPYPLLNKKLSAYTISELKQYQTHPRDAVGQLYAIGRFQTIPTNLNYAVEKLNIPSSAVFDVNTQNKIGEFLLYDRVNLRNYLRGNVPDNETTLNAAALDMAKTWASIGVPYATQGYRQYVNKDQSYYSGGGDHARVKSENVKTKLRQLRYATNGTITAGASSFGGVAVALILFFFYLI